MLQAQLTKLGMEARRRFSPMATSSQSETARREGNRVEALGAKPVAAIDNVPVAPPTRSTSFRAPLSGKESLALGFLSWGLLFAVWQAVTALGTVSSMVLPSPVSIVEALYRMIADQGFLFDVLSSVRRVTVSFFAACVIAVPLGVAMGSFPRIEALFNPIVAAWRYLPAPSFVPLLLMWFGTGDLQKLALLFLGVVWFLITLVMDHTKAVRADMIETALTLGGKPSQVVRTVIFPAAFPSIFVALRQMLATSWTYLVIAEIVAASDGIGAAMMRAGRFIRTDEVMAGIVVIGILGLAFDYLFDRLQRVLFPYAKENA